MEGKLNVDPASAARVAPKSRLIVATFVQIRHLAIAHPSVRPYLRGEICLNVSLASLTPPRGSRVLLAYHSRIEHAQTLQNEWQAFGRASCMKMIVFKRVRRPVTLSSHRAKLVPATRGSNRS